jgi:hypothetical protein
MTCTELEQLLQNHKIEFVAKNNEDENTSVNGLNYDFENEDLFMSTFEKLLVKSHEDNFYWQFCTYKTYKTTFETRLSDYQKTYFDADVNDFIDAELTQIQASSEEVSFVTNPYTDEEINTSTPFLFLQTGYKQIPIESRCFIFSKIPVIDNLRISIKKKLSFLTNYHLTTELRDVQPSSSLSFKGTQVEFVELVKSLVDSKMFEENQKTVFEELSQFFNIKLGKDVNLIIQGLKGRNQQTKFLDSLQSTLYQSLNKEKKER